MFNNAGQAWNHGFFWNVMAAGGGQPSGKLAAAIEAFGGLAQLKAKFVAAGVGQFGSGWAWAQAKPDGTLEVFSTANGDTALLRDGAPILGVDVWEHAYYLDYKQDRKAYLEGWFDKIVNWEFAGRQFEAATGAGEAYRYPRAPGLRGDSEPAKPDGTLRRPSLGAGALQILGEASTCCGGL